MYTPYLPAELPKYWETADIDETNGYIEFLGFGGEFLVSMMEDTFENPKSPYHLCMNQLKGIIGRFDFEHLDWQEWYETPAKAMEAALKLMGWMNENYSNFLPMATEILASLGTEAQLPLVSRYFEGDLKIHDSYGQVLVFGKIILLSGSNSYEESAISSLCNFARSYGLDIEEVKDGLLTNEKFELIEDLRPAVLESLSGKFV